MKLVFDQARPNIDHFIVFLRSENLYEASGREIQMLL